MSKNRIVGFDDNYTEAVKFQRAIKVKNITAAADTTKFNGRNCESICPFIKIRHVDMSTTVYATKTCDTKPSIIETEI
ncbi:hypothetical protein CWO31_04925 [Vibrio splendidus]|nr:hypothetical protein CWO31_04925 [Vibrio splendidus]